MVAFGHTALGTIIGLSTYGLLAPNHPISGLAVAAGAGIISHYLADFIPHGHFEKFQDYKKSLIYEVFLDFGLSLLIWLGIIFFKEGLNLKFWYVLSGIGGSQLPDLFDGLIYIGLLPLRGLIRVENNLHILVHWHGAKEKALMWSRRDIWQVALGLVSLWLLLRI